MSYFAYAGFFLKEPEGITWSDEAEDATYYYEFKKDGTFYVNIGSVEIRSTYQKTKSEDGNTIIVGADIGSLVDSDNMTFMNCDFVRKGSTGAE